MRHRAALIFLALYALCLSPKPPKFIDSPAGRSPSRQKLFSQASKLFYLSDYDAARAMYETAFSQIAPGDVFDRTSALIGIGGCLFATQQYSAALTVFARADELARVSRLNSLRIIIASNRASIYRRMGDLPAAVAVIEQIQAALLASRDPAYLTQAASLLRGAEFSRALPLYFAAIRFASEKGDGMAEAVAWLHLGTSHLQQNQLAAAEAALTHAFRLRVLNGRRLLQSCYYQLGCLRRRQGRLAEASTLLFRAKELSRLPGAHIALPYVEHEIARVHLDAGNFLRAVPEFEDAVRTARDLRLRLLPAETFRISAETNLQEIFSEYVKAGMQHFRKTGDIRTARRMFEISEESRAALFEANQHTEYPPEYWRLLSNYQRALSNSVGESSGTKNSEELTRLGIQLADVESRLGVRSARGDFSHQIYEKDSPGGALSDLQRKLKTTEAVLSFHCAQGESYIWALTRDNFEVHFAPPAADISAAVTRFRRALLQRDGSVETAGAALHNALLSGLSESVRRKPEWLLSLDGSLFELPFAALPERSSGRAAYVGHLHSLRSIPGALARTAASPVTATAGFASVADPVYNAADPRWDGQPPRAIAGQQLARLPGTAREAAICARAWSDAGRPVLLTGRAVNWANVLGVLGAHPAILHIAAHVLPHPRLADQVLIALGLQSGGEAEYLGPTEIAAARMPVGLVTLSGCGSASGAALPGLGLFGLTRAWLTSGTSAVVATQWPVADDNGEILAAMYSALRKNPGSITASSVAKAMQLAQIQMAQSTGWRAEPAYWSAYTVAGRD